MSDTAPDSTRSSPGTGVGPIRQRRWFGLPAALVVAALLSLLFAVVVLLSLDGTGEDVERVLLADDVVTVSLEGVASAESPTVTATVSFSAEEAAAVAAFTGLASLPGDAAYQVWVVRGSDRTSAGVFSPTEAETIVLALGAGVESGDTIEVTIEPAGGSARPTGEVVLAAMV